jgi:hypothetical protein
MDTVTSNTKVDDRNPYIKHAIGTLTARNGQEGEAGRSAKSDKSIVRISKPDEGLSKTVY